MDRAKIEEGVRLILEGVGEDPGREGLVKTPERVAKMYEEVFAGLTEDPAQHFETTFDEHHEEMVLVRDIPFYSMCEHHLAPFFGVAHVAYIPHPMDASADCRSSRAGGCVREAPASAGTSDLANRRHADRAAAPAA